MGAGLVQLFIFIPTMVVLMISCIIQLLAYTPKLLMILWLLVPMHIIYLFLLAGGSKNWGGNWPAKLVISQAI